MTETRDEAEIERLEDACLKTLSEGHTRISRIAAIGLLATLSRRLLRDLTGANERIASLERERDGLLTPLKVCGECGDEGEQINPENALEFRCSKGHEWTVALPHERLALEYAAREAARWHRNL